MALNARYSNISHPNITHSNLHLDPEYAVAIGGAGLQFPKVDNVFQLRELGNNFIRELGKGFPIPEDILQTEIPFQTHDGTFIKMKRFTTEAKIKNETQQPAVFYVHGGGMVSGSVELYSPMLAGWADNFDISFFAVDYRLAPEQKGPNLTEDVFAGLKYLSEHAKEHNIDPKRIAIMGDSAGGGLATGAALIARDRGLKPPLAKQVLIYPMLDDRTRLPKDSSYKDLLVWTEDANNMGWKAVLGNCTAGKPKAKPSIYAVPGRAKNLKGLPPTYIDVGQLDLFVGEDVAYADRLMKAEVEVELHVLPGLPHVFENAPNVTLVRQALEARKRALHTF